jgi:hypothetical protein
MKSLRAILTAIAAILVLTGTAFSQSFIVYDFQTSKGLRSDARVMGKMLRTDLEQQKGVRVKNRPSQSCSKVQCAKKTRNSRNVDAVIIGELDYLGGSLHMFASAVYANKIIRYDIRLKNVEEFNRLSERLAIAIVNRESFEKEMGMDSVASSEKAPFRQKQMGDFSIGLLVGGWAPLSGSYLDAPGLYQLYFQLKYELADLGFELNTGYFHGTSQNLGLTIREYGIDFAMLYYFSKNDRSPFVGGTVGVHGVELVDGTDNGDLGTNVSTYSPVGGLFVGYEFGRAQFMSFHARLGYKLQYLNQEDYDKDNFAHGPYLTLGVSFF